MWAATGPVKCDPDSLPAPSSHCNGPWPARTQLTIVSLGRACLTLHSICAPAPPPPSNLSSFPSSPILAVLLAAHHLTSRAPRPLPSGPPSLRCSTSCCDRDAAYPVPATQPLGALSSISRFSPPAVYCYQCYPRPPLACSPVTLLYFQNVSRSRASPRLCKSAPEPARRPRPLSGRPACHRVSTNQQHLTPHLSVLVWRLSPQQGQCGHPRCLRAPDPVLRVHNGEFLSPSHAGRSRIMRFSRRPVPRRPILALSSSSLNG